MKTRDHHVTSINVTAEYRFADFEQVSENPTLKEIYRKAKSQQWDADMDIDWSHTLDDENPLQMPDETIAIFETDLWRKMSRANRAEMRNHLHGWNISQILHGEQGALFCSTRITQSEENLEVKYCNAIQVADEARHMEVYNRLLSQMKVRYPVSSSLDTLLRQIAGDPRHDFTSLGMQIIIEGLALSFFKNVHAYSKDELVRSIQGLVLRDEARHFATGQVALGNFYGALTTSELQEREEFVVEACHSLTEHLIGAELWKPLGLTEKTCRDLVQATRIHQSMTRSMFRQLVPAINKIGLLKSKARRFFDKLGVFEYANYEI